jgi:uncharacterized membrane protein
MTGGPFSITILSYLTTISGSAIILPRAKTLTTTGVLLMTKKQVRDLQAFAIELIKEGKPEAAKEVLSLIAHG